MAGTGKSQVLKALSSFFEARNESYRFMVVAPTGTAAALLKGFTYHYVFRINEYGGRNASTLSKVQTRLQGVEYVFLDEVSMLSCLDLYKISSQCSAALNCDLPFGGLNFVFAGDFAQLPPAVGKENISLYSRTVGAVSTDTRSQLQAMGKAFWHQVTTVVILRKNMRQRTQTDADNRLRTALENMRYAKCTPDDIAFLRTRISSRSPDAANVCDDDFREVSIITATNMQKDVINELGSIRFAREHGRNLVDFYSEDILRTAAKKGSNKANGTLTDEMQRQLWEQMPFTSGKIPGKLSLCVGLPVMIRVNVATELCMTRGQEGYVYGWQSSTGSRNQRVLDTLFIKLKNPPTNVQIDGLPENVIPMTRSTNLVYAQLTTDTIVRISRGQVEIAPNFSMTDYASQGKTRLFNLADLMNITSHFGYYTALSRSASACGTLILQGFNPSVITRGISGALRQEFRELEILDEVTALRHAGKLPITVVGDTRNALIKNFRAWKGEHYVPSNVPKPLRWSKRDPLRVSEIYDASKIAELKNAKKYKKEESQKSVIDEVTPDVMGRGNVAHEKTHAIAVRSTNGTIKRKMAANLHGMISHVPKRSKNNCSIDVDDSAIHMLTPLGVIWNRNSCAYDALITILYGIWISEPVKWKEVFSTFNPQLARVSDDFKSMSSSARKITFENARDRLRCRLQALDGEHFVVGSYTSLDRLADALLFTNEDVFSYADACPNRHQCAAPRTVRSALISLGAGALRELSECMRESTRESRRRCGSCNNSLSVVQTLTHAPPMIALEFAGLRLTIVDRINANLDGINMVYVLKGVIYFGNSHFTSRIVRGDGQVWYHDGLETGRDMVFDGSCGSQNIDLYDCRGRKACMAIYVLQLDQGIIPSSL